MSADGAAMAGRGDALRPGTLNDFGGQPVVVDRLRMVISAAVGRTELPDHMLFSGPPGLGKTTLAGIVANELGVPLIATSGPVLEKAADLVGTFVAMTDPAVVFIDEIHQMGRVVEETLYPAMEDGVLDFVLGEGMTARTVRIPVTPFVLVGATTRPGDLTGPLRDRFGVHERLELYAADDLALLVERSAGLLNVPLTGDAAMVIAQRSRGTPRIANMLVRRVRDWAHTYSPTRVDGDGAADALTAFGVDHYGLDPSARALLTVLCTQFGGGPVGVNTWAAAANETPSTITEMYEPYLMSRGLVMRTPRGRVATGETFTYLGLPVPAGAVEATA